MSGPRRSWAAVEAKLDQRAQAPAVLGHLAQHEQDSRAVSSPRRAGSTARETASTISSPESQRHLDVADAELGAHRAGVLEARVDHQVDQRGQGDARPVRPGSTRWASRRLAPLLRSMPPSRSTTMSPSSMLSVISASSAACSAARSWARAVRATSSSIRSLSVPTARPVSRTATRKTCESRVSSTGSPRLA